MAKLTHSIQVKGNLYLNAMLIEEVNKEDVMYYNLKELLKSFDGKEIVLSVKDVSEIPSMSEEELEEDKIDGNDEEDDE